MKDNLINITVTLNDEFKGSKTKIEISRTKVMEVKRSLGLKVKGKT